MAQLPQAVVWDHKKSHHLAIMVDNRSGRVQTMCIDCDGQDDFPSDLLSAYKQQLRKREDTQILHWVEVNHDG